VVLELLNILLLLVVVEAAPVVAVEEEVEVRVVIAQQVDLY
jgi:hypothetical protein